MNVNENFIANMELRRFVIGLFVLLLLVPDCSNQTYEATMAIYRDKLSSDNYNTEIRPIKDQSQAILVNVSFELVSIVEVNDVLQSFVCNGFLIFSWNDERVVWDPANYHGQTVIHPLPEKIWRPRVIVLNTLGERDLFDDNKAPVFMFYNGKTSWVPGSLFPTSCELHMENYPFDQQSCTIQLVAMSLTKDELQFMTLSSNIGIKFSTTHEEWDLIHKHIEATNLTTDFMNFSSIKVTFVLKRRPYHVLINIILPVIFLSFLNLLVFFIPVKSGEKVSYGITVLLALTVFMSMVSSMLPRSSLEMPKVTIYIFILLCISMLTVCNSIIIVFLHHMDEKKSIHQKAKESFQRLYRKVTNLRRIIPKAEKSKNYNLSDMPQNTNAPPHIENEELQTLTNAAGNSRRSTKRRLSSISTVTLATNDSVCAPECSLLQSLVHKNKKENENGISALKEHIEYPLNFQTLLPHAQEFRRVSVEQEVPERQSLKGTYSKITSQVKPKVNKYKVIGNNIDFISFLVFFVVWVAITSGFLIDITI